MPEFKVVSPFEPSGDQPEAIDAIANGILDSARTNGETILRSFFANAYDLDQYELIFT